LKLVIALFSIDNPIDNLCFSRKTGNDKYAHFDLSSETGAHDSKRFESSSVHEVVAGSETVTSGLDQQGKSSGNEKNKSVRKIAGNAGSRKRTGGPAKASKKAPATAHRQ